MVKKIFYVFMFLLFSCNETGHKKPDKIKFTDFPLTEKINTDFINLRNVQAYALFSVKDIYIITQAWIDKGYFIKFFDKKTLKYKGRTGKHGMGPGELANPDFPAVDINNKKVYFIDQGRNRDVFEFDIEKSIEDKDYIPKKLFEIGNDRLFVSNFVVCKNHKFVIDYLNYTTDTTDYLYTVLDEKGEIIRTFGDIPYPRDIPTMAFADYTDRHTIYHNNKLITAFAHDDKIVCYNFDTGEKIFETDGPDLIETEVEVHSDMWVAMENRKTYTYKSVTASDKYIYALYSGYSRTVFEKGEAYGFNTIFVFDFNGKPVKKMILDHFVRMITYDKETNTLIGIQNDEEKGMNTKGLVYVNLDAYGL